MSNVNEILNKGVPVNIPTIQLDVKTVFSLAKDRQYAEQYFHLLGQKIYDFLEKYVEHGSLRCIGLVCNLSLTHNTETKCNELHLDDYSIMSGFIKYLSAEEDLIIAIKEINKNGKNLSEEEKNEIAKNVILRKCDRVALVTDDQVLKGKYPLLYEEYLKEKNIYDVLQKELKKYKGNKRAMYEDKKKQGTMLISYESFCDSFNMYNARNFTKLYSKLLKELITNYDKYGYVVRAYKTNILDNIKCDEDALEAYMATVFIERIKMVDSLEDKQNLLYFLTSYFNSHDDWKGTNKIIKCNDLSFDFDKMYNDYMGILYNNKELKAIDINRDEFDNYTQEQVESIMKLILLNANANWVYFDPEKEKERIERAIINTAKNSKDKNHKTPEELRELLEKKKRLYENSKTFMVIVGKNAFDGYIAYAYPNGKVIMDRYYEKLKNGEERIAIDQAIYVFQNIKEFEEISKYSKQDIIKDKLCKRHYHKGEWEDRVKNIIDSEGSNPFPDYMKLVKTKKIKDYMYKHD